MRLEQFLEFVVCGEDGEVGFLLQIARGGCGWSWFGYGEFSVVRGCGCGGNRVDGFVVLIAW